VEGSAGVSPANCGSLRFAGRHWHARGAEGAVDFQPQERGRAGRRAVLLGAVRPSPLHLLIFPGTRSSDRGDRLRGAGVDDLDAGGSIGSGPTRRR
jgi:hypothetical protein